MGEGGDGEAGKRKNGKITLCGFIGHLPLRGCCPKGKKRKKGKKEKKKEKRRKKKMKGKIGKKKGKRGGKKGLKRVRKH